MLKALINITKQQLILPFYHLVNNETPNFVKYLYKPKSIADFKTELNFFLNHYEPISLAKLIAFTKNKTKLDKPYFHLTFDDGLSNFYEVIAPILIKKKIVATVFLNTNFVDNKNLFYRYKVSLLIEYFNNGNDDLKIKYFQFISKFYRQKNNYQAANKLLIVDIIPFLLNINFQNKEILDQLAKEINFSFNDFLKFETPYLSLVQIKKLQKHGFTFGVHSINHPHYKDLSLDEQIEQTKKSLAWLQDNLDIKYKVFSFPFSDKDVSKQFFKQINLDLSFGTSAINKDVIQTNLQRLDMEKSLEKPKLFIVKKHLNYLMKFAFRKHIIKRN